MSLLKTCGLGVLLNEVMETMFWRFNSFMYPRFVLKSHKGITKELPDSIFGRAKWHWIKFILPPLNQVTQINTGLEIPKKYSVLQFLCF